jgi:hypothetical protein
MVYKEGVASKTDVADRKVFTVDEIAWAELQALVSAPPGLARPMAKLVSNPSVLDRPAP